MKYRIVDIADSDSWAKCKLEYIGKEIEIPIHRQMQRITKDWYRGWCLMVDTGDDRCFSKVKLEEVKEITLPEELFTI